MEDVARLGTTQYGDYGLSCVPYGSRTFLILYLSTATVIESGGQRSYPLPSESDERGLYVITLHKRTEQKQVANNKRENKMTGIETPGSTVC